MKWLKANFAIFGMMLSVSAAGSSTPAYDNQNVEVTSYPALTMDLAREHDPANTNGINEKLGKLIKEKKAAMLEADINAKLEKYFSAP